MAKQTNNITTASRVLDFIKKKINPDKPMQFRVGEGLTEKQKIMAQEVLARPVIQVGPEAKFSQSDASKIVGQAMANSLAEKEGKSLPHPGLTQEMARVGSEQFFSDLTSSALGFIGGGGKIPLTPITKSDAIIKNFLRKVNTEPVKKATKPIGTFFTDFYRRTIDRFNPIVKATRQAEQTGAQIPKGQNPEMLARRYLGIKGISESKLDWKTWSLTPDGKIKITGEGLGKILYPIKNNLDDLRALLVAEREKELFGRGIDKGIIKGEADQVVSALKTKLGPNFAKLQAVAQGIRDYAKRAILDPLKEVGAVSQEVYNAILKSNQFYTPFARLMKTLENKGTVSGIQGLFQAATQPLKRIKGSEKQIIDPLETIINNTYRITNFVEKARVANSIVGLRNFGIDEIKKVSPKIVPVAQVEGEAIFRPSFFNPAPDTIAVLENGKRAFYKVPSDLAKLMNELSPGESNIIMNILSFPAKTLRAGATLSPEFIGRNPIRDQFTAFIQSKFGYTPFVDLIKGIWELIGKNDVYGRWLASGGAQSMLVSLDRAANQKKLRDLLMQTPVEKIRGLTFRNLNPIEALRKLSETGEAGTRLGEFRKGLKAGASDIEAGFAAREVTLDFSRLGSNMKALTQITAFIGARIQGLDKIVRIFAEKPVLTTAKVTAGITVPSIILYLNNRNDPRYQEIPQWQKDLFWIIMTKDEIYRIPKPFELGVVFGTVPERILEWVDKNDPEVLKSVVSTLTQDLGIGSILPTALLPIIENTANYKFFTQRPIVSQAVEGLPDEMQDSPFTSESARKIGQFIKASPAKIENTFLSYTGGLGRYALSISDSILKNTGLTNPPPLPEKTLADTPFIRAFVVRTPIGSVSESVNKFYDLLEETESWEKAARETAELGDIDGSAKFMKEHPEMFLAKGLRKTSKDLAQLRQVKETIFNSRELTPEQKREQVDAIDSMMTELARQALEFSDAIREEETELKEKSPPKQNYDEPKILDNIKWNESRGEKDPYGSFNKAPVEGNPDNLALGAYRVTTDELETNAERYLGKSVTKEQFLASPEDQDTYMKNKIKDWKEKYNMTDEEVYFHHRFGLGREFDPNHPYLQAIKNRQT